MIARPALVLLTAAALASASLCASDATAEESAGLLDGVPLNAGTAVEVPAGSTKQLVLADGGRITLHGGASAVVARASWFPPERGEKSVRGSQLHLRDGEITVRLPSEGKPMALSVAMSGGQSLLAWRGVSHVVARDGEMTVAVDEGAVYVGAQEKWMRVSNGASVVMHKKQAPESYTARLAAPTWPSLAAGGLGFVVGSDKAPVRVTWQAVPSAAKYRAEIASDAAMSQLIDTVETPASALVAATRLGVGTYYARLFAIGGDGVASQASTARPIRVANVALPTGAFAASDGVIVLPPKAEISLDPPNGYEFASAGGTDIETAMRLALGRSFTPAIATLRLDGQNARAIRVRDAAGSEGQILLARRELRARVEMTPPRARWPANPIDATVRLEDPNRRLDTATEPVRLEVRINAQIVPAEWKREGSILRTRIEPVGGPGPFLVSVVAKDVTDKEIGSHIVDVDGPLAFELKLPESERKAPPPRR